MKRIFKSLLSAAMAIPFVLGCYDISRLDLPPADSVAPEAVSAKSMMLIPDPEDTAVVELRFVAPADTIGGREQVVFAYDIAISEVEIGSEDRAAFEAARQYEPDSEPKGPGEDESMIIGGLKEDSSYFISVRSRDEAGNISPSTGDFVKTSDHTSPPGPEEFSVQNPRTGNSLLLVWSYDATVADAEDVEKFLFIRKAISQPDDAKTVEIEFAYDPDAESLTYEDSDPALIFGETYEYSIYAVDDDGNRSEDPPAKDSSRLIECNVDNDCPEDARPRICKDLRCITTCSDSRECEEWSQLYPVCSDDGVCISECDEEEGRLCPGDEVCDDRNVCRLRPIIISVDPEPAESGGYVDVYVDNLEDWTWNDVRAFIGEIEINDILRLGNPCGFELPILPFPDGKQLEEFDLTISIAGVSSPPYSLPVYDRLPLIERIEPNPASRGEDITLTGRNFKLGESLPVTVRFSSLSLPNACEVELSHVSDDRAVLSVPDCASSGPVNLIADSRAARLPLPELILRETIESRIDLEDDPPVSAALTKDGKLLAVVCSTGLRLYRSTLGALTELHCGRSGEAACLALDNPVSAGFLPGASTMEIFVYNGTGDERFLQVELDGASDYESEAPAVEAVNCTTNCEFADGPPMKMYGDAEGKRLMILAGTSLHALDLESGILSAFSITEPVWDFVIDPLWKHAYALQGDPGGIMDIRVIDIAEYSNDYMQTVGSFGYGSPGMVLSIDLAGRMLFANDPNMDEPRSMLRWNLADGRNPAGMSPLLTIPALKAVCGFADGSIVGAGSDGSLHRLSSDSRMFMPMEDTLDGRIMSISAQPGGDRVLAVTDRSVELLSLDRSAAIIESVSPELLVRGEEISFRLSNDVCEGKALFMNIGGEEGPANLGIVNDRAVTGTLPVSSLSGPITVYCAGSPESAPFFGLVGKEIRIESFQSIWDVDGLDALQKGDDSWIFPRNDSPGEIGLLKFSGGEISEHDPLDISALSPSLIATDVDDQHLVAIGLNEGLMSVALDDLPNWIYSSFDPSGLNLPGGIALDSDYAIVSDRSADKLVRIDIASGESVDFDLTECENPGMLVRGEDNLFVLCEGNDRIEARSLTETDLTLSDFLPMTFCPEYISRLVGDSRLLVAGEDRIAVLGFSGASPDLTWENDRQLITLGNESKCEAANEEGTLFFAVSNEGLFRFDKDEGRYRLNAQYDLPALSLRLVKDGVFVLGLDDARLWLLYM